MPENDRHGGRAAIILFCPGSSLTQQVADWAARHPGFELIASSASSFEGVRDAFERAAAAVIDATDEPGRAAAALDHVVALEVTECVAVYTETMHTGLELYTRVRGALLVLGPLEDRQWDDLLDGLRRAGAGYVSCGSEAPRPGRRTSWEY